MEIEEDKYYHLTGKELDEFGKGIVVRTLVELGYKPHRLQSGRIYRQEMIAVLGSVRKFEKARETGRLKCFKDGSRNSKVWSRRSDWQRFLADH